MKPFTYKQKGCSKQGNSSLIQEDKNQRAAWHTSAWFSSWGYAPTCCVMLIGLLYLLTPIPTPCVSCVRVEFHGIELRSRKCCGISHARCWMQSVICTQVVAVVLTPNIHARVRCNTHAIHTNPALCMTIPRKYVSRRLRQLRLSTFHPPPFVAPSLPLRRMLA